MTDELSKLKTKLKQQKLALNRQNNYLNKIDLDNLTSKIIYEIRNRLDRLPGILDSFNDIKDKIELIEGITTDDDDDERDNFEQMYFSLVARMEEALQIFSELKNNPNDDKSSVIEFENNTNNDKVTPTNNQSYFPQVQLPLMQMPKFDGDYNKWLEYRDSFNVLIDNNTVLSNVQKMHHLRLSLEKEALETIKAIPVSDQNYRLAWQALQDRYEKSQLIVNNHVRLILDFPRVTKESSKELRSLYNNINNNLEALRNLSEPVDSWTALLIPIITDKFDISTRREWEKQSTNENVKTVKDLLKLLRARCDVLEKLETSKNTFISNSNQKANSQAYKGYYKNNPQLSVHVNTNTKVSCFFCKGNHTIYKCDSFLKLDPFQRYQEAKKLQLCLNCLRPSHSVAQCQSSKCKRCAKAHNTLLHLNSSDFSSSQASESRNVGNSSIKINVEKQNQVPIATHSLETTCNFSALDQVLLSTACVSVKDARGKLHQCRVLLDSGAMSNFITKSLCDKLDLNLQKVEFAVSGVGEALHNVQFMANLTISSNYRKFSQSISCLVLDTISSNIPLSSFSKQNLKLPNYMQLADPSFNESRPIDLLLGSTIFWQLLCGKRTFLPNNNNITLYETRLGWVLGGQLEFNHQIQRKNRSINCFLSDRRLEDRLAKFWQVEEVHVKPELSKNDQVCENHFISTHKRDEKGQFVVSIPFKDNVGNLGASRKLALNRFYSQENKLIKNPKLHNEYVKFMLEYESLGHMRKVQESINHENIAYYIPHHAVIRESSKTTKLRVVFNASMKTDSGLSLNDVQHVGPIVQSDLITILLNFRTYEYVMCADISKMYRMIWIDSNQQCYHRIFWRNNRSESLQCYELKTVTYGTASAPYLATRCLHQLSIEFKDKYPEACEVIRSSFYVDDLLCGSDSEADLIQLQHEISSILASAGFQLRKWLCNRSNLLEQFKTNSELEYCLLKLGDNELNKTLGLFWNAKSDSIQYSSTDANTNLIVTKRQALSEIAQIYDPLGLVGPITINGKLFMQKLWQEKILWDDAIPEKLLKNWQTFRSDLVNLSQLQIPRHVIASNYISIELHGFCDASERAYGAVIYVRSKTESNQHYAHLLCAKSRVAPLKKLTLPRLELCAAHLLAQLTNSVKNSIKAKFDKHYFWSDSTITLSWLRDSPQRWKTFVANRVSQIQELTNVEDWYHVSSKENPADILSRGAVVSQLQTNQLWWSGPQWLTNSSLPLEMTHHFKLEEVPETRTIVNISIFNEYSNLTKLQRTIAYCFRFFNNCKLKSKIREPQGSLTVLELNHSLQVLICLSQKESFPNEYNSLLRGQSIDAKSKLLSLLPFMDENQLVRVGGRLQNSQCSFNIKHPIILSAKHRLTVLLFEQYHEKLFHCGPTMLLAAVRQNYWPITGRNIAKGIVRRCKICFRAKPKNLEYLMGNLPDPRVNQYFPFYNVGLDYSGPFLLKDRITRGAKLIKSYLCLFICLSTKSIHLETVTDLTTESFIACLRRFISRRGKPRHIYSDNAKNFIGASCEIKKLYLFIQSNAENICNVLSRDNISWHFIPARSPSFGGIWEAGIKSVKYHLKRVLGNSHVTHEEFSTIICQIESILNSRPLCPLTTNTDDIDTLTPGHFLIGRALTSLPDAKEYQSVPENRLKRYERLQKIVQDFWARWRKEYLNELQIRTTWKLPNEEHQNLLKVGTVVVLKEDNIPPMQWSLGRIVKLHPGNDGIVRVVSVKVRDSIVKRSVRQLCVLPVSTD